MKNRAIIVTGAASGIGKETVIQCLEKGAVVLACDINEEGLKQLTHELNDSDCLYTYPLDVSDYDQVFKLFEYLTAHKAFNLYGLVNNAGVYLAKNILDYTTSEIDHVLEINLKGSIYFSKLFGKMMLEEKQKGVIVNMSSVAGMEGSSDAIYGATKAAILGLTKSCAMNFSPYIRVNVVSPTMVQTSMMEFIPEWRKKEYLSNHLIQEPLTSKDVAESIVFLLSDQSKHYTGVSFDINNGGYLR